MQSPFIYYTVLFFVTKRLQVLALLTYVLGMKLLPVRFCNLPFDIS